MTLADRYILPVKVLGTGVESRPAIIIPDFFNKIFLMLRNLHSPISLGEFPATIVPSREGFSNFSGTFLAGSPLGGPK